MQLTDGPSWALAAGANPPSSQLWFSTRRCPFMRQSWWGGFQGWLGIMTSREESRTLPAGRILGIWTLHFQDRCLTIASPVLLLPQHLFPTVELRIVSEKPTPDWEWGCMENGPVFWCVRFKPWSFTALLEPDIKVRSPIPRGKSLWAHSRITIVSASIVIPGSEEVRHTSVSSRALTQQLPVPNMGLSLCTWLRRRWESGVGAHRIVLSTFHSFYVWNSYLTQLLSSAHISRKPPTCLFTISLHTSYVFHPFCLLFPTL